MRLFSAFFHLSGYSPSKKSQLPASQRPAPGSRPLPRHLGWVANGPVPSGARRGPVPRGSRPPRPFVLFPLPRFSVYLVCLIVPRKRQRPRVVEERATPLELTAAAAVFLLHRQAFDL